ncbi:MAG: YdcF family protein [Rickettsiales bacterium]|nr:YdcF family protein [Rickettsiales bacterium]
MISHIAKRFVLAYIAIKTFFEVIFDFIKWLFTNRITLFLLFILLLAFAGWGYGLYDYTNNLNKDWRLENLKNPNIADRTDAIIVLTGGSERVRNALYLLEKNYADKLFISGVNVDVKPHEIFVIHNYSEEQTKRLLSKVFLGYSANDTIQNAAEIERWIRRNNLKSIRLITSNYHIKRAMIEVQARLPDIKIIPHAVMPINIRFDEWWKEKTSRDLLVQEYNKLILAKTRILLEGFGL